MRVYNKFIWLIHDSKVLTIAQQDKIEIENEHI
jgi:hypothetical protein